ncbi:transcriptional regulator with XRE-family HTH domain [Pedobacter sp. UYP24]
MKNTDLAKRIKELRARKGMSQEELAEKSQLSLRTVQRIEGGETEPRGDTLQRLAEALGITPDELIDWTETEDKGFITLLNLSALSFIAFPILGIVIPLALWMLKKDKIKNVNDIGKKLLNFQISWCIIMSLFYLLPILLLFFPSVASTFFGWFRISSFGIGGFELMLILIPLLYAVNFIVVIFNSIRSYQNKKVYYQPAVPFLR